MLSNHLTIFSDAFNIVQMYYKLYFFIIIKTVSFKKQLILNTGDSKKVKVGIILCVLQYLYKTVFKIVYMVV